MSVYTFYQDPGHGWIDVSLAELTRLGIADKISAYSYTNGARAYLEEDCDAAVWIQAKRAHGEDFSLAEVYQDPTPIRQFDSYKGVA